MRRQGDRNIEVVNVRELEQSQLYFIQKKIAGILVKGDKIPTPLVTNLKISEDGIMVNELSNTANFKEISTVLNISKIN